MEITYRTGDLMTAEEPFILHGCNAQGVMGKGVAKLIRDRYPIAFEVYEAIHRERGLRLGEVIWVETDNHVVLNAVMQENYRKYYEPDGIVYVDYEKGVRACMRSINQELKGFDGAAVAMPLVGAGLAGGRWSTIASIIEEESTNFRPIVYLIDGKIPS